MPKKQIILCKDAEDVARRAAQRFAHIAKQAISRNGRFAVALSGGNTPRAVNGYLAERYRNSLDWSRIFIFWGDERPVPPDHQDSNYRMAQESLIERVPILGTNVCRVRAELPAVEAARQYEEELRKFFPRRGSKSKVASRKSKVKRKFVEAGTHDLRLSTWDSKDSDYPVFDLIFLGMGEDGHTASLFPGTPALAEKTRWVVENPVRKLKTERITFTASLINQADEVIFLVSGATKALALKQVLEGAFDPNTYPSQLIQPQGRLVWLVDEAAASQLSGAGH